jgi:hypothetical protein
MDELEKDYLIDQVMTSIASFAAASRMAKRKLANLISQPGVSEMTTEQVLTFLIDFMDKESECMFKEYEDAFKKKISRSTTYIELIPEAPFNIENKVETISTLRSLVEGESFHLVQVYKDGKPEFITLDEF